MSGTDYVAQARALRQRLGGSRYAELIAWSIDALAPDEARLSVAPSEHLLDAGGAIHSGVIASTIDAAAACAVYADPAGPAEGYGATVSLFVSQLEAPAPGSAILVSSRVRKLGRTICVVDVSVEDETGALIATGSATYKRGVSLGTGTRS